MSNWLYRIGKYSARHRVRVVAGWVAIVLVLVFANQAAGGSTVDNFEVPGVESQEAVDLLKEQFPEKAGATAMVVFHTADGVVTDPESAAGIEATVAEVEALDHVVAVTDPLASHRSISSDQTTTFASVQFDGTTAELGSSTADALFETASPAEAAGVQVEYGGE